jgi:SAM-dependent methyltransferase
MDLKELQRNWEGLGATDPLWAVLTDPAKRDGRWNLDEFFASGEHEIANVMAAIQSLGINVNPGTALDFGCGVGRLTQALARRFQSVYGVDIAPSMIEQANRLNPYDGCRYLVNDKDDLTLFQSELFDFIYTCIVLQHMEPRYSKKYLGEFLRTLKRGGVLVFELPAEPRPAVAVRPTAAALDRAAYCARIEIVDAPRVVPAGASFEIRVTVRNQSPVTWPGENRVHQGQLIRLGNHWLTQWGEVQAFDDGRTPLPSDLPPEGTVHLTLMAQAPAAPGSYILELDLAHEWVTWFAQKGSPTTRWAIEAMRSDPAMEVAVADASPVAAYRAQAEFAMEMYAVPQFEVEQIISEAGCRIVRWHETPISGPDWLAYQYVVLKP